MSVGVSIISLQTSGVTEIIVSHKVSVETTTTKGYIGTGRASCWTLGAHSNSNIEVSRQRLTARSGEVELTMVNRTAALQTLTVGVAEVAVVRTVLAQSGA